MKKRLSSFPSGRTLLLFIGGAVMMMILAFAQTNTDPLTMNKKTCALTTGITMRYTEAGNPSGTPVIFLHGYTDTGRSFKGVVDDLTGRNSNVRMIVPDLRGHGASSMPEAVSCHNAPGDCFRIENFAADVIDLMNQLKIKKAFIVGHSMGSMIAQHLAILHPDRVSGIVLLSALINGNNDFLKEYIVKVFFDEQFRPKAEDIGLQWPGQVYKITPRELGDDVAGFLRANWVTESLADAGLLDAIAEETINTPLGTWIGVAEGIQSFDFRERLKHITVPLLVLSATQDAVPSAVPDPEMMLALEAAATKKRSDIAHKQYGIHALNDTLNMDLGHNFQWAAPAAVADDILSFIKHGKPIRNLTHIVDGSSLVTDPTQHRVQTWRTKNK